MGHQGFSKKEIDLKANRRVGRQCSLFHPPDNRGLINRSARSINTHLSIFLIPALNSAGNAKTKLQDKQKTGRRSRRSLHLVIYKDRTSSLSHHYLSNIMSLIERTPCLINNDNRISFHSNCFMEGPCCFCTTLAHLAPFLQLLVGETIPLLLFY